MVLLPPDPRLQGPNLPRSSVRLSEKAAEYAHNPAERPGSARKSSLVALGPGKHNAALLSPLPATSVPHAQDRSCACRMWCVGDKVSPSGTLGRQRCSFKRVDRWRFPQARSSIAGSSPEAVSIHIDAGPGALPLSPTLDTGSSALPCRSIHIHPTETSLECAAVSAQLLLSRSAVWCCPRRRSQR